MSVTPANVSAGDMFQIQPGYAAWYYAQPAILNLAHFTEGNIVTAVEGGYETFRERDGVCVVCARVQCGKGIPSLVPVKFLGRRLKVAR